jgi:hypothetical protein
LQQQRLPHIEKLLAFHKPRILWLEGRHLFLSYEDEGRIRHWHSQGDTKTEAITKMEELLCEHQTKQSR